MPSGIVFTRSTGETVARKRLSGKRKCDDGEEEYAGRGCSKKWEYPESKLVDFWGDRVSVKQLFDHHKQIEETGGFDVDYVRGSNSVLGMIQPLDDDSGFYPEVEPSSKLAIEDYNKKHGTKYEFEKVVKVNSQVVVGVMFYITFEAKDADGQIGNDLSLTVTDPPAIGYKQSTKLHRGK
ncbi:hypothetical protein RJ640_000203 [Escallonia rubra]|uniref:Cystatin domain-containing protein n=1 Tax=Escallonia rubra TaxID=112253 RepID=A0AA88RCU2_9ASTE|nr:hypothetical protein RJ640_000203 [Escallonia rubra]